MPPFKLENFRMPPPKPPPPPLPIKNDRSLKSRGGKARPPLGIIEKKLLSPFVGKKLENALGVKIDIITTYSQ